MEVRQGHFPAIHTSQEAEEGPLGLTRELRGKTQAVAALDTSRS